MKWTREADGWKRTGEPTDHLEKVVVRAHLPVAYFVVAENDVGKKFTFLVVAKNFDHVLYVVDKYTNGELDIKSVEEVEAPYVYEITGGVNEQRGN